MKKYYIGILVLLAVCAGAFVYALSQAGTAKADKTTDQAVEQIASKLDVYTSNHGSLPQSLNEAGIKDVPSTVSYQALRGSKYKVCFDYHTAAGGFDAGWGSLLLGGVSGNNQSPMTSSDGSYFDSGVEFKHKKGENCQTVSPYLIQQNCYDQSELTFECDQRLNNTNILDSTPTLSN